MCRIAGIINSTIPSDGLQQQVRGMCRLLKHGGPDDEGIYIDGERSLVFGHRRLSLIDLSPGGHQPMVYNNDQLVITYNGELYNYPELKKELVYLGYQFNSTSDTEVILAAFAAWGTKAFKRFNGMYAFALLNKQTNRVYLVRDPAGIKPLYYLINSSGLSFASEVRAFSQPAQTSDTSNWPVYFLAYGHVPEPITTISGVKPLSKGCFLEYDIYTKTSEFESFTHFSYIEKIDNYEELKIQINETLSEAVQRHLLSDAPIGAFLSGGIDSSIIALLAGQTSTSNLNTLSIYFDEGAYSEKKFQDLILDQIKCNHSGHLLNKQEFEAHLPRIISDMDMPSCDGINTWFISKYAKESGLKAVLSGLGGDELFGGYPSFQRIKATALLQQLPNSTLRAGKYSQLKKFRRLPYLSLDGIKGKFLFLRGQYIPTEIARHLDMSEEQVWKILEEEPTLPSIKHLTPKNQASWMEMNMYMQNQLLRDSDVMSMAHGLEIRVPFLDTEFIKLVLQINSATKYAHPGKQLLIDAFKTILPPAIYNRPKMGFAFPFKEWLSDNEWVKDQLSTATKETRKTYQLFLRGQYHWSQVMILLLAKNKTLEKTAVTYA